MEEKQNLTDFVVGSLPTAFYIPNFVTEAEQEQLLDHIYNVPGSKWKSLKNRRLQNWGGVVHEKGLLPQDLPPWLKKVTQKIEERTDLFPSPINHVLINEYLPDQGIMPHQDGPAYFPVVAILSLGSPVVMNFSPHLRLADNANSASNFHPADSPSDGKPFSLLLMPCSLMLFKDAIYSDFLHGIEDTDIHDLSKVVNVEALKHGEYSANLRSEESTETKAVEELHIVHRRETRVSLTCRVVLKVHKKLFKF